MAHAAPKENRGVYDWDTITDGSVWVARRGEDFFQSAKSYASALYWKARRLGIKVRVWYLDGTWATDFDTVQFVFYREEA